MNKIAFFTLLLLSVNLSIFAQHEQGIPVHDIALKSLISSTQPASPKTFNPIGEAKHGQSLVLANNIIIRMDQLNVRLLDSVSILRWPDMSSLYGDAAENGIIFLKTRQKFATISIGNVPIPNASQAMGEKKFILNGYLINNLSIKISRSAIKKVEVLNVAGSPDNQPASYISIWTLTEEERRPLSSICNLFENQPTPSSNQ